MEYDRAPRRFALPIDAQLVSKQSVVAKKDGIKLVSASRAMSFRLGFLVAAVSYLISCTSVQREPSALRAPSTSSVSISAGQCNDPSASDIPLYVVDQHYIAADARITSPSLYPNGFFGRAVIDTGFSRGLLPEFLANKLEAKVIGHSNSRNPFGKIFKNVPTVSINVALGKLVYKAYEANIGESDANGKDTVIIGNNFFTYELFDFDLPHGRLFVSNDSFCMDKTLPVGSGVNTLRMVANQQGVWEIPLTINGLKITGILDTGATLTTMSRGLAHVLGVSDNDLERDPPVTAEALGHMYAGGNAHLFKKIYIGGIGIESAIVVGEIDESVSPILVGLDFFSVRSKSSGVN